MRAWRFKFLKLKIENGFSSGSASLEIASSSESGGETQPTDTGTVRHWTPLGQEISVESVEITVSGFYKATLQKIAFETPQLFPGITQKSLLPSLRSMLV